ncbi:MAG: hypothetical protein R3E82_18350 [Pseudomonadales bacterium]|nr:hypothetical protein [Pseudomonadales bacterium]
MEVPAINDLHPGTDRGAPVSAAGGFTIVELVTVIILLGILSMVAMARFVQPSAFVPGIVGQKLVAESRIAQQLAVSRADARVSLRLDRQGGDWRMQVSTDVDGVLRTELVDADNSRIQATSGGASAFITAATALSVGYSQSGDLSAVLIGTTVGDATLGVDLLVAGDSDRQVCIHPSGYSASAACI